MLRIVKCTKCGVEVQAKSTCRKYCDKCAKIVMKEKDRAIYFKKKAEFKAELNRHCELCGKDITNIPRARRYCPDCRHEGELRYYRAYYNKYRDEINEYERKRRKALES